MRRYENLNWLDQTKHEKFATLNGYFPNGPHTIDVEDAVNFDGEVISADIPPNIVQLVHEST